MDTSPIDVSNFKKTRNSTSLTTKNTITKFTDHPLPPGPIKGLAMSTTKNSRDSKMMMTFLNQSVTKLDSKFDLESV